MFLAETEGAELGIFLSTCGRDLKKCIKIYANIILDNLNLRAEGEQRGLLDLVEETGSDLAPTLTSSYICAVCDVISALPA